MATGVLRTDPWVQASRFMSSRVRRQGGIILCFHQIAPQRFLRWIRLLKQCFHFISLDELIARHNSKKSLANLAAITFDDGWASTCEPIAEICVREKWPITIYVMSSLFESADTFWFAEFPSLLIEAKGKRLERRGRILDLTNRSASRKTTQTLREWLRTLPNEEALQVITAFREDKDQSNSRNRSSAFIDRRFLERYAKNSWITFGSHSVDHQSLSAQSAERITWQLSNSKASLEEITGVPVKHFCYPYGDSQSIGELAPKVAKRFYSSATTMIRGVCNEASDTSYLPRIPLYDNDNVLRCVIKICSAGWIK